ncbi:MAG: DUF3553 domain-containing protein [Acidocella sp.]|nr:DUF3553 domain-containing protein [Acidocella sp.]
MRSEFEPGQIVRHPGQPGWGRGQVQSALAGKVTVMFENAGKIVVNTLHVDLQPETDDLQPDQFGPT